MNKKPLLIVIVLLIAALLTASFVGCDGDGTKFNLSIENIVGVSDAVIDNEAKTVAFRVQNSTDSFPIASIGFTDGEMIVYEAYADEELTQKYEGDAVPLAEGDNVFWVKGWIALAADNYAVYKFTVTRTRSEQSVKSIAIDQSTWKTQYVVNEMMPQFNIVVTYADDTTETVPVTAEMIEGFDTSSPGTKEIRISYEGATVTATIEVKEAESESGALTLGAWQTAYFVGEEIYLEGAYLLYDDGENVSRIAITEDMVTGFDTAETGEKQVTVSYAGNTISARIKVYAFEGNDYEEVKKSTLDEGRFFTNLNKIFAYFNADVYDLLDSDREKMVDIFEYVGLTDEDVESVVSVITAQDVPLLSDIKDIIDKDGEIADVLTQKNVEAVIGVLNLMKDKLTAKQLVNTALVFIKLAYGYAGSVAADSYENEDFYVSFTNMSENENFIWGRRKITAEEALEFINGDPHAIEVFEEFTSEENAYNYSEYGDITEAVSSEEAAYVAGALLDSIATACDYDAQKIYDMVSLAKKVTEAVTSGDLEDLLGGQADGLSYKAMVAQLNELGKLLGVLNETFAEDPLLVRCGANVLDEMFNSWSDTMMIAFKGNTVMDAVVGIEKMAIECLKKVDANFVAEIYLDYDDFAKEKDAGLKDRKLGYLIAKVAEFVYPEYQKLELKEKAAIDDATDMIGMIGININLRGFVDIAEKAAVKDADEYTAEELIAIAEEFDKIINGESTETEDRLTVYPYGTVIVKAGCSKQDLAEEILSNVQIRYYDASLGTSLFINDLASYTINFDATKEGFFDAEIVIEGAKATVECYAYDSSTPSKFVLYKERRDIDGYAYGVGDEARSLIGSELLAFKHIATGRIVSVVASIKGYSSAVDTSEAGYYMATMEYENDIFGTIELPVFVSVIDFDNITNDMVNEVRFSYCEILPVGSEILIGADVYYGFAFTQNMQVETSGLDNSTIGKKTFTASLAPNELGLEYSEQLEVTVVSKEEAMTVTDANVAYNGKKTLEVGTDVNFIEASYGIGYEYYPADNGKLSTIGELNEKYLSVQGLKIILQDFDVTQASDCNEPNVGKILLVSSADESIVYAQSTFEYFVYDPAAEPPVVTGANNSALWSAALLNKTYTESEIATLESFIERTSDIVGDSFRLLTLNMSDGSTMTLSELAEQDLTGRGNVVSQLNVENNGYDLYKITINIDYLYLTIGSVKVIPDAFRDLPTEISVGYSKYYVLQGEELTVDNVIGSVTFGYGYDEKDLSGSGETGKMTIEGDCSEIGTCDFNVTYTLGGITVTATSSVDVISLEKGLGTYIGDLGFKSYILDSADATEDALLKELSLYGELYMTCDEFSIFEPVSSFKEANDYWENKGINVRFAIMNADGEFDDFDGSVGALRSCAAYICAEYYGHSAAVKLFDVFYAVKEQELPYVYDVEIMYFDRKVFIEEEKNSGAWTQFAYVSYYDGADDYSDSTTLYEFLERYPDFSAELEYNIVTNDYNAVVKGPYAYYRYSSISVVPDDEANLVTSISVLDVKEYIMYDETPVAGKDFKIILEYGYGYSSTEMQDYSSVEVELNSDSGDERYYVVRYEDFEYEFCMQVIRDLSFESNIQGLAYDRNGSFEDIVLCGEIYVYVNSSYVRTVYASDRNIADVNRELENFGASLSLLNFDQTLAYDEQGDVKMVIGESEPVPVKMYENGKAIVDEMNLVSVSYRLNEGEDQALITAEVQFSYFANGVVQTGSYSPDEQTIGEMNSYLDYLYISYELVGLDTSLPPDGQSVYLVSGNCSSGEVVPVTL